VTGHRSVTPRPLHTLAALPQQRAHLNEGTGVEQRVDTVPRRPFPGPPLPHSTSQLARSLLHLPAPQPVQRLRKPRTVVLDLLAHDFFACCHAGFSVSLQD
jgi:hypothetical protein